MDKLSVVTKFDIVNKEYLLFVALKEIQTKINEIVEVINFLEPDNSWMSSVQHRGGSDA